ncbi:MAG: DUF1286 domain-containing protein [Nitrososphaerota archaeon]|jgi:hypothetical protein|nr:DUF1286 domain-containing protein [Nitrososphaerota archaeon]MDG6948818.1 DUF1286 domain-containing protein [Nitrososphaerota archaeon]
MRLFTHTTFSYGTLLLGTFCFVPSAELYKNTVAVVLLCLAWLANHLIDRLGHSMRNNIPVRMPRTHSVFTAPLWGLLSAVPFYYAVNYFALLPASTVTVYHFTLPATIWLFAAGVYVAYNHLFLDSMTQAGVYFTTHRIAIAHLRYNDTVANTVFVALGLLAAYVAIVSPSVVALFGL